MVTTPQAPESAPVATPVPASMPAAVLSADAPVKQKAAPVKRAKLPAQKVASEIAPVPKAVVKKAAVKKVVVKKTPPRKVAAKAPVSNAFATVQSEKTAAPQKAKKDKLVRDSFTIPKSEFAVLDELKQRAAVLARPVKKSELLRAGIKILANLSSAALLTALAQVPTIKTGRPTLKK